MHVFFAKYAKSKPTFCQVYTFFLKCIAYFIHVNNALPISPFTIASHVLCATTWLDAGHSITYYGKSCVGLCHAPHARAPFTCLLSPSFLSTRHSLYVSTHTQPHTHTYIHTHTIKVEFRSYSPFLKQSLITFFNDGRQLAILLSVPACLTHYVSINNGQQQFPPPLLFAASSHTKHKS